MASVTVDDAGRIVEVHAAAASTDLRSIPAKMYWQRLSQTIIP